MQDPWPSWVSKIEKKSHKHGKKFLDLCTKKGLQSSIKWLELKNMSRKRVLGFQIFKILYRIVLLPWKFMQSFRKKHQIQVLLELICVFVRTASLVASTLALQIWVVWKDHPSSWKM